MDSGLLSWPLSDRGDTSMRWPRQPHRLLPSIRQSAARANGTGTTVVLTPAQACSRDNLLLAWVSYSQFNQARTLTAPAGWTALANFTTGNASFSLWWKIATLDDTGPFTFTISGSSENGSGVLVEVQNYRTDVTPMMICDADTAGRSITDTVYDRRLSLHGWKRETATTPTIPTGWTVVQNTGNSGFHQTVVVVKDTIDDAPGLIDVDWSAASMYIGLALHPGTRSQQ